MFGTPAPATPVAPSQRLAGLDVLRGLALAGVLFANLPFHYSGPQLAGLPEFTGADGLTVRLIGALFTGKFFVLFSLLFGLGLVLQRWRARARGENVHRRYVRRLLGLVVLGIAHGVLLFDGDILMAYGLLGFALLGFVDLRPSTLVRWATALIVTGAALTAALPLAFGIAEEPEAETASPLPAVALRALAMALQVPSLLIVGLQVFGMFLLGVAAAEGRWLQNDTLLRRWRGPVLLTGLALAVPGGWLMAGQFVPGTSAAELALGTLATGLGGPLVALGMVGWVGMWLGRAPHSRLAAVFGTVGRMSLTCYLGQSLLLQPLLAPEYFGLSRTLPLWAVVPLGAAVYATLAIFAWAWLRSYRFGPAEWLLRSWTYAAWQPMRQRA